MSNVKITKQRENVTTDKSNVDPLLISDLSGEEVKASIHPTSLILLCRG